MNKIQDLHPYRNDGIVVIGPNVYIRYTYESQAIPVAAALNAAYQLGYAERVYEELEK